MENLPSGSRRTGSLANDLDADSPLTRPYLVEIGEIDLPEFAQNQGAIVDRYTDRTAHQHRAQVGISVERPGWQLIAPGGRLDVLGAGVQVLALAPAGGDDVFEHVDQVLHQQFRTPVVDIVGGFLDYHAASSVL